MVFHLKYNSVAFAVSGTPGTGTITVGTALDNQSFTPAERSIPTGFVGHWRIEDGTDVEIVEGTYSSSGPTITRDRVMESKIAGVPGTTKLTLTSSAIVRLVDSAEEWNEMYAETMARSALAKIVASQTDYVKTFTYDVRKDSDGGFWTDQCSHTSWWNEAASATRGARRSFPKIADIVLRSGASSTTGVLQIFDRTDLDETGKPRLWMSFNCTAGGFALYGNASATLNSVFAINGRIYVTSGTASGGFTIIDFPNDRTSVMFDTTMLWYPHTIAERNTTIAISVAGAYPAGLVSRQCLGVHARAIGTTVDAMGLVIPTVAVATAAGTSVILTSGAVWDITRTGGHLKVLFESDTELQIASLISGGNSAMIVGPIPTADIADSSWWRDYIDGGTSIPSWQNSALTAQSKKAVGSALGLVRHELTTSGTLDGSMVSRIAINYATGWLPGDTRGAFICDGVTGNLVGANVLNDDCSSATNWTVNSGWSLDTAGGNSEFDHASGGGTGTLVRALSGLTSGQRYLARITVANRTSGTCAITLGTASDEAGDLSISSNKVHLVSFTASATTDTLVFTPVTGFDGSIQDVQIDVSVADRSSKGKDLRVVGTLSRTAVNTGNDLVWVGGFSGANYLEQPYNSDLDFGTGDLEFPIWIKVGATAAQETIFARDSSSTGKRIVLDVVATTSVLRATIHDGTNAATVSSASAIDDAQPHIVELKKSGTTLYLIIDGAIAGSASAASVGTLTNASAILRVGLDCQGSNPGTNVQVCLLRPSAYASTQTQYEKRFRDERPLFDLGAKAFLGGTSISVSDLDYDEDAKELAVATGDGVSIFNGLRRVAYLDNSIFVGASDTIRGVSARAGNRSIVTSAEYIAQSDKQYRNDDNSMAAAQARIRLDLSTEIAARSAADSANAASISAEATARGNADTTLQNNINTLSNTVTYGKLVGLSYGHGIP